MTDVIHETFSRAIEAHSLAAEGERLLLAVSGGGDSVALLHLMIRYAESHRLTVAVAHVNHRLRGPSADQDQDFVQQLCARLGVPCLCLSPNRQEAGRLAAGGEEAARILRHRLLSAAARRTRSDRIALGHTMDDQAETVLMRLVRGAGRRGLSGMAAAGPGKLIRPMLAIRREEARRYLEEIGQTYREDESNADTRFLRNRIRSGLIPVMEDLNRSVVPSLARTASLLAEEDRYLDSLAADWVANHARPLAAGAPEGAERVACVVSVPADRLVLLPAALSRRVARALLKAAGGDPRGAGWSAVSQTLDLARSQRDGDSRDLGCGLRGRRQGSHLVIVSRRYDVGGGPGEPFSFDLPIPGDVELADSLGVIRARLVPVESGLRGMAAAAGTARREGVAADLAREPRTLARLDAAVLGPRASVRSRLPGDQFHPLGASGRRKLKEFLIDLKVPRARRDHIPLVVGPAGIAWVVGQRIGHPYRVTDTTREVAVLVHSPGAGAPGADQGGSAPTGTLI